MEARTMVEAPWVLVLLAKATVVLLGGVLAATALRRAAAGARYLVWLATLASLLLLPALARFAPLRLEVLPAPPAIETGGSGAPAARPQPAGPDAPSARAAHRVTTARRAAAPDLRLSGDAIARGALLVWAGGAAALLAWLAMGMLAARRLVRGARPLESEAWTSLLCETADRLDLATLPALAASERVEVPFAFGTWRSTIVLPAGAESWPEERRRVVLFHELAHVRRRDLWGHVLGRLACAVYWFHPLAWTASRRLRAESECACDDLVLACGARASDYAGHLLDILGAARGRGMPAAALPMARRREFEGRVLAILDPGRARRGPGRAQSAALLFAVSVVFVCVSAAAPARPAAPVTRPVALAAVPDLITAPAAPAPAASLPAAIAPRRGEADERGAQPRARENPPATATAEDPSPAAAEQRDRRALLVRVLRSDTDASVRRSAAWALADSTRPDEIGVLIAALRGDADGGVREMAAWALAQSRGEDASAALTEALRRDASAEVRATAAWGLGHRRHADVAGLLKATTDDTGEVREAAIWALGQQRVEKAPPELVTALGDREARVRLVAAWALGQILDGGTAPALRAAFAKEEDAEVRRALFRALAFLGDHTSELLDKALASKDPELRSRAVLMLGGGGPGIWPWPWPWPQPRPMP